MSPSTPLRINFIARLRTGFGSWLAEGRRICRATARNHDALADCRVPGERGFLSGIINVRGKVVPVADLRKRFDMEIANANIDTRFIVTEIDFDGVPTLIAIVADKVFEVTEIPSASMEEAPKIGMHWRPEFIRFIGKWKDDFVVVPNMERIFN